MKGTILSLFIIAIMLSSIFSLALLCGTSPARAASSLTWLHTDGKSIKNEAGQIIYLRGVVLPDMADTISINGGIAKLNLMLTLLNQRVNVLRVVISPYPNGDWSNWPNSF
jgi:hypothetical protein